MKDGAGKPAKWWQRWSLWWLIGVCVVLGGMLYVRGLGDRPRTVMSLIRELKRDGPNGRYREAPSFLHRLGLDEVAGWFRNDGVSVTTELKKAGVEAVEPLIPLLDDNDSEVREAARDILAAIEGPQVVGLLIGVLDDDRARVRQGAATALGMRGDRRAVEALARVMKRDQSRTVRLEAMGALSYLGGEAAVDAVIGELSDSDREMRYSAVIALGHMGDRRATDALLDVLGDEDAAIRRAAVWVLGQLKDMRAVEPLVGMLSDVNRNVVDMAVRELGELKDERAAEPLLAMLGSAQGYTRELVARSLGEIGGERAREAALTAAEEKDLGAVRGMHKLLIEEGDPGLEEVLIEALCVKGVVFFDEEMMRTYLLCGNERLAAAAHSHAERRYGRAVSEAFADTASEVTWGSRRDGEEALGQEPKASEETESKGKYEGASGW